MTRLNWALFREQKKLAHPLLHTTPQRHRSARFREGKTLLWGHPAKQHASPGVLWLPAALLSGDGLWLRGQRRDWGCWGAPETAPPPASHCQHVPRLACQLPGSSGAPAWRKLFQHLAAASKSRSSPPLGSDTTDMPLK